MGTNLDAARAQLASYRELPNGPLRFVDEHFGAEPDPWQTECLIAFADPRPEKARISLQAAAGVGKSAVMSWCAWYFLATQCHVPGEHPKGLVTGVTDANLRDNFWAEMNKWQTRSPFLNAAFTWSRQRIFAKDHPGTWFLGRRNWPKSGTPEEQGNTLSGLHSSAVAAFVDESGSIPPTVLRAGEQALADGPIFGKIMQSGNPISLEGMLYAAATQLRRQWTIIVVNNDPDDPRCAPRGDKAWARLQIETYGRENPWVKSYILGRFPPKSINQLVSLEDVERAIERRLADTEYTWAQKRLGVDVARFGDDRSVIFPRQGLRAYVPATMRNARTTDIAARVAQAVAKWGSELQLVDDTGHWGHGVIDNLITAGIDAMPVVFHEPALDKAYRNRRAEMWIEMAKAIQGGLWLPQGVPDLVAELTTPTYTFINGQFALEEKDLIKKRLGRSPDLADALALTYAIPDQPSDLQHRLGRETGRGSSGRNRHAATEYDPFAEGGLG